MNWDRLLALHHVCTQWHGGQWSKLYRLGCVVAQHITVRGADEYPISLDLPENEEARRLYGVYAVALGGCKEGSTYMECACDGCEDDWIIGEEWERGILRCPSCQEHGCDHRGCVCPEAEEEAPDSDGMTVVRDGLMLCEDCMIASVNGELPEGQSAERLREIDDGLRELGPYLVPAFDSWTGKGIEEFSSCGCDCCGSPLAGKMYEFAVLGKKVVS